jgi:catechol 2,3-dioxygenase-like lactoylglutathione lyase family enzyme
VSSGYAPERLRGTTAQKECTIFAMIPKAAYITPMLRVADVRRSINFYRLLGLELMDYEGDPTYPSWARMHSEGGDLMFLLAETAIQGDKQPFFLYLYTNDLTALREHLLANGVNVSEIQRHAYMQSGEISVSDPDGYGVFVGQWGTAEHQRWERDRRERLARIA